ncbi:hypothetical protein NMY22_g16407 [Coprinellus aureogranulatus]|nr:hypothetical protein NMY22_g16407 [Coprinellus aureogranulatus]
MGNDTRANAHSRRPQPSEFSRAQNRRQGRSPYRISEVDPASEEHTIVPERPGPNPVQDLPSPDPHIQQENQESSSSHNRQSIQPSGLTSMQQTLHVSSSTAGAQESPLRPPTYRIGVITAKAAHDHLQERMAAIAKVLKDKGGLSADQWFAQLGFMGGRTGLTELASHLGGMYGRATQLILITVLGPLRLSSKNLDKLVDKLSKEIGFYGLLICSEGSRLLEPTLASQSTLDVVFQPDCGTSKSGFLARSGGENSSICVQASNGGDAEGPTRLETDFEFSKENREDGSCLIKFGTLSFRGPEGYKMASARVWISSKPMEGQGSEKSRMGCRGSVNEDWSEGYRKPHKHDSARKSITITYSPTGVFRESDKQELILKKGEEGKAGDLPRVTITPDRGERLGSITIWTLSKWELEEGSRANRSVSQSGDGHRLIRTLKKPPKPTQHRQHDDVVFCTEIAVPYGAQGGYEVVCDLATDF